MPDASAFRSLEQCPVAFIVNGFTRLRSSSQKRMRREHHGTRAAKREIERLRISQVSTNRLRTKCLELVGFRDDARHCAHFLTRCAKAPYYFAPKISCCADHQYHRVNITG